jgi:uncharacterized cupin superfamily protein
MKLKVIIFLAAATTLLFAAPAEGGQPSEVTDDGEPERELDYDICSECDELTGLCKPKPDGTACGYPDKCSKTCWDGTCGDAPVKCGICEECDELTGACKPKLDGFPCGDPDKCSKTCWDGTCGDVPIKCKDCEECDVLTGACKPKLTVSRVATRISAQRLAGMEHAGTSQ